MYITFVHLFRNLRFPADEVAYVVSEREKVNDVK